ncbi:hypothetical protein [Streptomyces sp. WMMB303]|uniref:hypothetical protein n=1 Tax=Streptomyces sp. WMMB303 TaxID=3034154 RepID=UPI0023EE068B|nr:hypothetical protein [Streptomyces sp. WMMB303]MDF4252598.1 hypothetical protein [Streptomyces sp. WMMB303]
MKIAGDDVTSLFIPECGHFPAEETSQELLSALHSFLAPYRALGPVHKNVCR